MTLSGKFLACDAVPVRVSIVDISKDGIGLLLGHRISPGAPCALAFDVMDHGTARRVNVWAKAVYCVAHPHGGYKAGIRIRDCDAQSRTLLDSLVHSGRLCGW